MQEEQSKLFQTLSDLTRQARSEVLCATLARGLVRAGLDHCQVILGTTYHGQEMVTGECVAVADAGRNREAGASTDLDSFPIVRASIQRREPLVTAEALSESEQALIAELGLSSWLICPMIVQERQVGYALCGKRAGKTFNSQEVLLYGTLAALAGSAVEAARRSEQQDAQIREITVLRGLAEKASYGLLITTPEGSLTYANQASHDMFGYSPAPGAQGMVGLSLSRLLAGEAAAQFEGQRPRLLQGMSWQVQSPAVRQDGSTFQVSMLAFGILDSQGHPLALACVNQDMTAQTQLERERAELNQEMLVARERLISELSAPLIPITENILVLPLIGSVDSSRAQVIMDSLLQAVDSHNADVVIIDVTGVPVMDTGVANHLLRMTDAASLVGAKTILVGITPRVAQTIVELGVDLSSITTRSNLQGGVEYALRLQGRHIASIAREKR